MQAFVAIHGRWVLLHPRTVKAGSPSRRRRPWSERKARVIRRFDARHATPEAALRPAQCPIEETAGSERNPFVRLFRPVNSLRPPNVPSDDSSGPGRTARGAGGNIERSRRQRPVDTPIACCLEGNGMRNRSGSAGSQCCGPSTDRAAAGVEIDAARRPAVTSQGCYVRRCAPVAGRIGSWTVKAWCHRGKTH